MAIGRNDPCVCGSGKKYKSCCLNRSTDKNFFLERLLVLYKEKRFLELSSNVSSLRYSSPDFEKEASLFIKSFFQIGDPAKATNLFLKCQDKLISCEIVSELVVLALKTDYFKIKTLFLKHALAVNCNKGEAHFNLGHVYANELYIEEASEHLKIAFKVLKGESKYNCACLYSMVLQRLGEFQAAIKVITPYHIKGLEQASLLLASYYLDTVQYQKSLEVIETVKTTTENKLALFDMVIRANYRLENYDLVIDQTNAVLQERDVSSIAADSYVNAVIRNKGLYDGLETLENIVKERKSASIGSKLGILYSDMGKRKDLSHLIDGFSLSEERLLESLYENDDENAFSLHKSIVSSWNNALESKINVVPSNKGQKKLCIGFISTDLRVHSVAYFLKPLLENIDKNKFDVWCYFVSPKYDKMTLKLKSLTSGWRNINNNVPAYVLRSFIQEDGVDVLIELNGHTTNNAMKILSNRVAPVQISWLGYPFTTATPNIDYRLVSPITDLVGVDDEFYTEKRIWLKDVLAVYQPPENAPDVVDPPCKAKGNITFGVFNNFAKVTEEMINCWAEILKALPGSSLLLKSGAFQYPDFVAETKQRFATYGVSEEQIHCYSRIKSNEGHLGFYGKVDISLDTFPYNGATTSCESLWMGVPVVTKYARSHRSRVTYAQLKAIGLEDLASDTNTQYVSTAISLAQDVDRLISLRKNLRQTMKNSPLMDYKGFSDNFIETVESLIN